MHDVKTYRGANYDSGQYMLLTSKYWRQSSNHGGKLLSIEQIDIENIKDKTVRRQIQLVLQNRFSDLVIDQNLDRGWVKVKNLLKEVAFKIVRQWKRNRPRKWWNSESVKVVEKKSEVRIVAN